MTALVGTKTLLKWVLFSIVLNQYCFAQPQESASEAELVEEEIIEPKMVEPKDEIVYGDGAIEPPSSILTTIGTWLFVFAVFIVSAAYLYKRGFFTKNVAGISKNTLQVVETAALGSRQFLVLARVHEQEVLLGVGPGFITKIESVKGPEEESPPISFEERLGSQEPEGGGS